MMCSPIKVGFLLLDVDRVEGIEPEPGGEGEAGLVRPPGQGRHHNRATRLAGEREEYVGAGSERDHQNYQQTTVFWMNVEI